MDSIAETIEILLLLSSGLIMPGVSFIFWATMVILYLDTTGCNEEQGKMAQSQWQARIYPV